MKWKSNVKVTKNHKSYVLTLSKKSKAVEAKDNYIVEAMMNGIHNNERLKALIMDRENIDENAAAFGLGQFILDYGVFIEEDDSHYMISDE